MISVHTTGVDKNFDLKHFNWPIYEDVHVLRANIHENSMGMSIILLTFS